MKLFTRCLIICLLLNAQYGFSNSAQPGIFQAGGITNFSLLFPADSFAFRKIQMVNEKITIQLYHGFAVVKGEYQMFNYCDTALKIKVGYPLNASFASNSPGSLATNIFFDELYALKSYTNDLENTLLMQPIDGQTAANDNNWYIWESSFKPKDTTKLTVYFVVNTNNTIVRQGYARDEYNGFVYLLETGATWKQPIARGEIKIGLVDNLSIDSIRGLSPSFSFKVNTEGNILFYRFNNLSPTFEDNIVLVYTRNMGKFDFGSFTQRRQALFGSVDAFSKQPVDESTLINHTFNSPFKVKSVDWLPLLTTAILIALSIIGFIVAIFIFRKLIRYIRTQRPSRGTEI